MSYTRTPSNHLVTVYDFTFWKERVERFLAENGLLSDTQSVRLNGNYGIVESASGKHYLIDNDACGSEKSIEESKGKVPWFIETYSDVTKTKMTSFNIYPSANTVFDVGELSELKELGKIPLHVFVRVFGARLDQNCHEWDKFLTLDK